MATTRSKQEELAEDQRLKEAIEKKHGKSVKQLYEEREKRLYDAVQMKVPDRVPVIFGGTLFACRYAGVPYSTAYYDAAAWKWAYKKMMTDLEPDAYGGAAVESGSAMEALESNYTKWPGGNLPDDVANQVNEQEFMKENEYALFLADPSDFILRVWLPRVYATMGPLAKLPPLMNIGTNMAAMTSIFASPDFEQFAKAMKQAGQAELKWHEEMGNFGKDMASLGIPPALPAGGGVQPPYSGFSNNFRTWRGVVVDMFRQPENLKAALGKIVDWRIATAKPPVRREGKPTLGSSGEAHRVSDEFLSRKQFEEFVWPFWKKAIYKTLELGYERISMFFEGRRDKQLEYFLEFPKGSLNIRMCHTDMKRAQEVLGGHACLIGGPPIELLQVGSPPEVEEYCKKLIQLCGKKGGFIMRTTTDFTQEAKPENVKAMIDSVNKYGWY